MAQPATDNKAEHREEVTFKEYSIEQAESYAKFRKDYPPPLIDFILKHHQSTGGGSAAVLDIGCGPGNSTRNLAQYFDEAYGLDASQSMIEVARSTGGTAKKGAIQYITGNAEICDGVPDQSVDLVTAAMAAHWFDMDRFWIAVARILKPGGTVALFNIYRAWAHPRTPNYTKVQDVLNELEWETLNPYTLVGNRIVRSLYKDLKMPWDSANDQFEPDSYLRKVWNENGQPLADGSFFTGEVTASLEDMGRALGTASQVTRWREAHPDLALTSEDCVTKTFETIRQLMGPGSTHLTMVGTTSLVMVKRS